MARTRRARTTRGRDERGAVALLVAVMMALLLTAAAFAIDLNMQRVGARDAQAAADLIALDMSRELDGSTKAAYAADPDVAAAFAASVQRNGAGLGLNSFVPEFGRVDSAGDFRSVADGAVPTAVKVTAHGGVGRLFAAGSGSVSRSAVATAHKRACLRVNSYLAALNSGDSWLLDLLLGDLLGSQLAVQLLDPENGLASINLDLLDYFDALGPLVGADLNALGFDSVARVPVNLAQLTLAAITVLERESGHAAEISLLRELAGGIEADIGAIAVTLGQLLELDTAGSSAVDLDLNLLDVVAATVAIANGDNVLAAQAPIDVPLPIGVGGESLVSMNVGVKIGQRPVLDCAGRAESSQIEIVLEGNLVSLDIGLLSVTAPLYVRVGIANVVAQWSDVRCTAREKSVELSVTSGLAQAEVFLGQRPSSAIGARPIQLSAATDPLRVALLGFSGLFAGWNGLEVASGTIALATQPGATRSSTPVLTVADDDYTVTVPASAYGLGLPNLHTELNTVSVLGNLPVLGPLLTFLGVGSLLQFVTTGLLDGLVNPLLGAIDWLIDPVLNLLGADIATGSVGAAPLISCGVPRLVG